MLNKALVLGFSVTIGSSFAADTGAVPTALSAQDQSRIRQAFIAAQTSEERALQHRLEIDRTDLAQSEDKQRREFLAQQQAEYAKYFASTRDPRARREFQLQQDQARKSWNLASQERLRSRTAEWARQLSEVRSRQQEHRRLMEQALAAGKKPEPHLWPPRGL